MPRINISFTEPESVTWEAVAHLIGEISKTTTFSELIKTLETLTSPGATWPGMARPPELYIGVESADPPALSPYRVVPSQLSLFVPWGKTSSGP